jgi:hypothetical protein
MPAAPDDPIPDTPDAGTDSSRGGRVALSVSLFRTSLEKLSARKADGYLGMITEPDELLLVVLVPATPAQRQRLRGWL